MHHLHRGLRGVQISKAAQITLLHAVVAALEVLVLDLAVPMLSIARALPVVEVCGMVQVSISLPADHTPHLRSWLSPYKLVMVSLHDVCKGRYELRQHPKRTVMLLRSSSWRCYWGILSSASPVANPCRDMQ